jgi:hypothetical protein
MTTALLPEGAAIAVRRTRCVSSAPSRPRVLAALDRLDPETGLSRSAILAVRHAVVSMVGDPPALDGIDLRLIASRAHRISASAPPTDCAAVVFADEADLLACLAADVAAGRLTGWWWNAIFGQARSLSPRQVVATAFTHYARALPAAASRAAEQVAVALALLSAGEMVRVLQSMLVAHQAPSLLDAVIRATQPRRRPDGHDAATAYSAVTTTPDQRLHAVEVSADAARPATRLALAVAAIAARLHCDPIGARSTLVADDLANALTAALGTDPATHPRPRAGAVMTTITEPVATVAPSSPARQGEPAGDPEGDGRFGVNTPPPPDEHRAVRPATAEITTALGGSFYLLALLDQLDLPASACGPEEPGSLLTRWGVLADVLRVWQVDPTDPLVDLIDDFAGPRPDGLATHRWAYRRPIATRSWLSPPSEPWSWWRDHDRLVVADADGAVADVPLDGHDPASVAAGECTLAWPLDASGPPSLLAAIANRPNPAVGGRRWAGHLAYLLAGRLAWAGLDQGIVSVPATIELTEMTVRVRMRLDDIDLGVRRAGLDCDPGWVPALARIVQLEFT